MVQVIKMENQAVQSAVFIANQTGSVEMGVIKSLQVSLLMEKLHNGIAHFEFIKKSTGELREAWGTLATNLVSAKVKGCQRRKTPNCICYYDVERGEFRSLLASNLIKVY
jgi:hypothetical protein